MMPLICVRSLNGCGFAGTSEDFALHAGYLVCLKCGGEESVRMLKEANLLGVTDELNRAAAIAVLERKFLADALGLTSNDAAAQNF